jgi:hypothetical protein
MTYEVMDIKTSVANTVFTSESFDEALKELLSYLDKKGFARLDLVVRERKSGFPLFRQMLQEITCADPDSFSYSDDYEHFCQSVYNSDYKDTTWAGYESYSKPLRTLNFKDNETARGT